MWVFNHEARDYTDQEVNLCEIVSGRIAAELERESVINEQTKNKAENSRAAIINGTLQGAFPSGPSIAPVIPGWNIAGSSSQASNIGGAFHDWMMLPDGRLAIWVGDGCDGGLAGAMAAGTIRGLLRYSIEQMTASGGPQCDIATLIRRCHTTLSGLSAGDHWVGMALLILDPTTGETQVISTGRPLALHVTDQNQWTGLNASLIRDDYRPIKAEKTPLWPETVAPKNTPNPRGIDRPSTQKPAEQKPANPKKNSEQDSSANENDNAARPQIGTPSTLIWNNWLRPTTPLGIGERPELFQDRKLLLPGDLLLGMNRGMADLTDRTGKPIDLQKLLAGLNLEELSSADMILELIQRSLNDNGFDLGKNDLATIVIQRGRQHNIR
jgi:serine phosphatase RsbU (regulator of sigma subunit)